YQTTASVIEERKENPAYKTGIRLPFASAASPRAEQSSGVTGVAAPAPPHPRSPVTIRKILSLCLE
uniref:Uncharacterized protein n=1 Tax=Oryza nivara TaxID=4536 RepID=A0A0E0J1X8_ORYNI